MNSITVLLAEDELALANIVRDSLEERNFKVILCANGEQALQNYVKHKPDIVALDVMMPRMDGFEVARKIREYDQRTPIIFLTARSQTKDVVAGFELGANDYLKKPFGVEELIVRMRVLLSRNRMLDRQTEHSRQENFTIGCLEFDAVKNTINHGADKILVTQRESELLKMLCLNPHHVVPRAAILKSIWGDDHFFNARSLDVFITRLRKHLSADPNIQIISTRSVGYKLVW